MFVDWERLINAPDVRALAALIRRRWGLWVCVADPQGALLPIGKSDESRGPRICEPFLANPGLEHGGACPGAAAQWCLMGMEGHKHASCYAGLGALLAPIRAHKEPVGTVFASGFIPAQDRFERLEALAARTERLTSNPLADDVRAQVPSLNQEQQAAVHTVLELIAQRLSELAQDAPRHSKHATRFSGMIGSSGPMLRLFSMIERVARTHSTALILGENGTGKELIAKAIHQHSRRAAGPFVVQNCAAIPADLMESELFGHKRGAFSGAHRDRQGLFEVAHQGTFFLDEIGEMDLPLQAKMLRVLQEGTFLPVGDTLFRKVDVRIICATNRDLQQMVKDGSFRQDLYYRINVITLSSPPLRERPADIPLLAEHFIHKAARVHELTPKPMSQGFMDALRAYPWPGNVRQLENELERTLILAGDKAILEPEMLSPWIVGQQEVSLSLGRLGQMTMPEAIEQLERRMILDALEELGWNKTQAAKRLGVSRRNLIRKVATYGFEGTRDEDSEAEED